ncbi:integrator complex subunit 7 [Musca domestica]|uniref:Integrator complex subunit 7 n=1 Tax=Musca domestica TaxID=7370 RepID=A0A1I8NII0_MUSDO|nr:integrator complex subunit 7 [Musca domestica]
MSSSLRGIHINLFNENFLNESEQDANSALTELDKGLRSKLGVQCEAIVRFPRLFEKYPFPILINSSFLKLAEFFLNGSNLLRFWVLRVCQQSENHLDKILSIDAFVKRIFMVIHSNDPVARALTLRTLGAVSRVIPEKQQVHHAIRRALDSHDTVEVEAAIYASSQFASQSRSFAISMCAKISDMIESLKIPVPMKLQLIPILRHMHHDANTAALVKKLCLNLLPKYPAESFVVAIFASLTELSARTLTGVPDQVSLLLEAISNDLRKPVRVQALKSLNKLAEKQCVHAWPKSAIGDLICKAYACTDSSEQYLFLGVILKLSDCPLTCSILLDEDAEAPTVLDLCKNCLCLKDYTTASQAITVLASLVSYANISNKANHISTIMEMINLHLQSLIWCTIKDAKHSDDLRKILACGIKVSSVKVEFGIELVKTLAKLLNDNVEYPSANEKAMCEALGSLCSYFQLRKFAAPTTASEGEEMETDQTKEQRTNPVLKNLLLIMRKLTTTIERVSHEEPSHTVEILSAVALQAMMGCFIPTKVMSTFDAIINKSNQWTQYRIARSASRYGQHYLAAHIYLKLSRNTVVDKMHFFLTGLAQLAHAECILNYSVTYEFMQENYEVCENYTVRSMPLEQSMPLMQRLEMAINLYWQALASLRASSSPSHPAVTFQLEFLKLRAQFLQTLHSAVTIKNAQIIVPPPAIAGSLAQNSRDYLQKFGHVTNQLRKLVKELKSCEEAFGRLYKSTFDADPLTLEFLEILQHQCTQFAHIVETICFVTPSEPPDFQTIGKCPETMYLVNSCRRMEELSRSIPKEPSNNKTINNFHLDIILAEIEIITKTPLCLPRYFFQVLQSTQIKLSVIPPPRSDGKPVNVQAGSNLVIKVEGVILHYGKRPSLFRSVDAVQLSLISKLVQTPRPPGGETIKSQNDTVTLTQVVKPQRDFLSGNFLVPISTGGQWQVTLETYVIDESGITWCTGPKNTMLVRVLEDPTKQQQTAAPSAQTRRF